MSRQEARAEAIGKVENTLRAALVGVTSIVDCLVLARQIVEQVGELAWAEAYNERRLQDKAASDALLRAADQAVAEHCRELADRISEAVSDDMGQRISVESILFLLDVDEARARKKLGEPQNG